MEYARNLVSNFFSIFLSYCYHTHTIRIELISYKPNFNIMKIDVSVSECKDTDNGATDKAGFGCVAYYGANVRFCGQYDDDDFTSNTMCCPCQTSGKCILSYILSYT